MVYLNINDLKNELGKLEFSDSLNLFLLWTGLVLLSIAAASDIIFRIGMDGLPIVLFGIIYALCMINRGTIDRKIRKTKKQICVLERENYV